MAIGFVRLEMVKRSSGKNACAKAAYNMRGKIDFLGTEFQKGSTYSWSHLEKPEFHEVLLPNHVDEKFKDPQLLWNSVELRETRINSQVAIDLVLALPDDAVVSDEMRFELAKSFIKEHFVDKGVACQIDIHRPDGGHNWHAHVLITTRYFTEDGKELGSKARDLLPSVRSGFVFADKEYHKHWTNHLNASFEKMGLSLRVDQSGLVPQDHLGPVRMRGRAGSLIDKNNSKIMMNELSFSDPKLVIDRIAEEMAVFTKNDIDRYLQKHVAIEDLDEIRRKVFSYEELVPLFDSESGVQTDKFTTVSVKNEEKQILRLADRIHENEGLFVSRLSDSLASKLTEEQKVAFRGVVSGCRLSCIDGHAGTGKSFLLSAIKEQYESEGYTVRAFGPDNASAEVLKSKGFNKADNIYSFLFKQQANNKSSSLKIKKYQKMPSITSAIREVKGKVKESPIIKGKEVWIVDEAGKLGNKPLNELLKLAEKNNVQLVFSGCSSQLPSIDRGGMFDVFCKKYGSYQLEDIQRQRDLLQKDIAKKLAGGQMVDAINSIVSAGRLHWAGDKEDACHALIRRYTSDYLNSSRPSSLIIATTNLDVLRLNEMVRQFRKTIGEIAEREFECETSFGKVCVSVGDLLEFRGNSEELRVTNGMRGVVIFTEKDEFQVQLHDGLKQRVVSFNPAEYTKFQLGYATTNFRSQGATTDRTYVLLSRHLNKESLYVSGTRQTTDMHLFISKQEFRNLAEVKVKACRSLIKETTASYITAEEIQSRRLSEEKKQKFESLKVDPKFGNRILGYGLEAWEGVLSFAHNVKQRREDRIPDQKFFSPDLRKDKLVLGAVLEKNISEKGSADSSTASIKNNIEVSEEKNTKIVGVLSDDVKELLWDYRVSWQKAEEIHQMIKEGKKEDPNMRKQSSQAFSKRNELAWKLSQKMSKDELRDILGKHGADILFERSARHEFRDVKPETTKENLEEKLISNIEALLFKLFPDGPTRKDRTGLRFGSKGSLAVSLRGEHAGSYHNFETGESGGLLGLIMTSRGLDFVAAKEWARDFLGSPTSSVNLPVSYSFKPPSKKYQEWISLIPPAGAKAPSLSEISKGLNARYNEVARHSYTDRDGNLLFNIIRLSDKEKPSEKAIYPLSYGHWHGESSSPRWWLKGFQGSGLRPLYNLHELVKNSQATVLVVEGEKTADAAKEMFKGKDLVCVTWCGGAEAVEKTDWSSCFGRRVVVWPDNDKAGFVAADAVCSQLRHVGAKEVRMVDQSVLEREFPQKWDLADPIPTGKNKALIDDLLSMAKPRTVDADLFFTSMLGTNQDIVEDRWFSKFVLRLTEDRLYGVVSQKGSSPQDARKVIFDETFQILSSKEKVKQDLTESGYSGTICDRLVKFSLASCGRDGLMPSLSELENAAEAFRAIGKVEFRVRSELSKSGGSCNHLLDQALDMASLNVSIAFGGNRVIEDLEIEKQLKYHAQLCLSSVNLQTSSRHEMNLEISKKPFFGLER